MSLQSDYRNCQLHDKISCKLMDLFFLVKNDYFMKILKIGFQINIYEYTDYIIPG
jgi:hypothetical protein